MGDSSHAWNGTRKPPKFRASCDACNEAKVRCSQTRPRCARCTKNGVRCVYGISQRSGKHSAESYANRFATIAPPPPPPPPTPPITVEMETPSSSNTQQLQNEAFDMFSLPNEISSPSGDLNYHSIFERDEIHTSNTQHEQSRSSYQQAEQIMQHGSVNGYGSVSIPNLQNSEFLGTFDGSFAQRDQDNRSDQTPYSPSNVPCASCTTICQNQTSLSHGTCRCSEVIIKQLSLLPALLQSQQRYDFDVELVQFQEAIRLCTRVLACNCADKDYTSVLAISFLISRILSVVGRGAGCTSHKEVGFPVEIDYKSGLNRSPKFSLGRYQIDEEDERNLRQEMWWLQVKKVEALVAGFKESVTKAKQRQGYQDVVQAATWEKLHFLLEQKAQAVKRDWAANRGKG